MRPKDVLLFTLTTSLFIACNRSEPGPSGGVLAATPNIYPISEANEHLLTPGAIENQIIATAQNANLEALIQAGNIARKAVDTLVKVNNGGAFGSGHLALLFGYPAILTSGHIFTDGPENAMLGISTPGLPKDVVLSFGHSYKSAYIKDESSLKDFGIIVFTDPEAISYLFSYFSEENFLKLEDLNFDKIEINSAVSGVCYTSPSENTPYPFYNSTYVGNEKSLWQIDNALTYQICSGGGIFDSNGRYTANLSKGYAYSQFSQIQPNYYDDSFFSSLYSIDGYKGLESLFNTAINQVK